jgi:hypothetical protein
MTMPRPPTLRADFNEFDEDGRLIVLLRRMLGPSSPEAGEEVELRDADGNSCRGRIEQVEGQVAYVHLDWETWVPSPPSYHQEPQGWWVVLTSPQRGSESRGVSEAVISEISGTVDNPESLGPVDNSADAPSRALAS